MPIWIQANCAGILIVYPIGSLLLSLLELSGADRLKSRSNVGAKREQNGIKELADAQIAAQTFTFRELAAATNNFRPESFIGEGGFGRVYKGRLQSTGQVNSFVVGN